MSFEPIAKKKKAPNRVEAGNARVAGLRAGMMAIDKAMGMSIGDIAESYKVSRKTVSAYLSTAEEEGFVDHYRKMAFDRLGSKVLAVYEAHLDQGSLQAAKDLALGLGILSNGTPAKVKEKAITTLNEWRADKEKEDEKHAAIDE